MGDLRLNYETLDLTDDDQRLIVYLPADQASADAVALLTRRPLGLVSG
jgi:hypothetical protein